MVLNFTLHLFRALLNAALSIYAFIKGWIFIAICYAIISCIDFADHITLIDEFDDDDDNNLNTSAWGGDYCGKNTRDSVSTL